jgi:hypothetical protein
MADRLEGGRPVPHSDWPDWWPEPYRIAHPAWHVWEGVAGLKYARRLMSSPPRVVRVAGSADDLKAAIVACTPVSNT